MSAEAPVTLPPADGLGIAVITASGVPLLLLDDDLVVIAASRSFAETFDLNAANIIGRSLASLGSGEWGTDHLRLLLEAVLVGDLPLRRHEINLLPKGRPNRRLSLDAEALGDTDGNGNRLLLAITDLTGIHASEKLNRILHEDKDVLLQELQHRIANSLQIISSVLWQSARRTDSLETKSHLEDAHVRILAVAAAQSHLATARTGDIQLRAYLTTLCRSIAASLIQDPTLISLEVLVDESVADADEAMNLGLIVTELVINALKYAFPDRRAGKIEVNHRTTATGWVLRVSDDGVGMRAATPLVSTGLGTSIVDALARKLGAQKLIAFGGPGVSVSITR